jgi:putative transposase
MAGKRDKPEEIVSKLRQVEVLQGQGMTIADAVRQIGTTQQTYYRWRKQWTCPDLVERLSLCDGHYGLE